MKSLRLRLTLWFGLSFVVVVVVFTSLMFRALDHELREKTVSRDYPGHPEWKLHGSATKEEVRDIMIELVEGALLYSLPLVALSLGMGYWLARKSIAPIASVNDQLRHIQSKNLAQRIALAEADGEFRDLVHHINDLLGRLEDSFGRMSEYAARVAHELRTHLTILRLKIEQSELRIAPDLADDLQDELSRLTHVTDQLLLIAQAEQRRVIFDRRPLELAAMVADLVQDFRLLASENHRELRLDLPATCWINADSRYLKQILHSLLTNAHRHGSGDIVVRLRRRGATCALVVANCVARPHGKPGTLGLGLRVVRALLHLDYDIRYAVRQPGDTYVARIRFHTIAAPTGSSAPIRAPRSLAAHDPMI